MKALVITLLSGALAACSTSPVPSDKAVQAPASQLTAYQAKPASPSGTIEVIRDRGNTGSLCSMAVFIDGQQVGRLDPGQKATFYLPPVPFMIGAAYTGSGLCGMGPERIEREASAKEQIIKRYRIFTSGDGSVDVLPTTF